jgi:hypothetical protein
MMKKGLLIMAAALMTLAPASAVAAVRVGIGFRGGFVAPFGGYAPYWGPYGYYAPYYPGYWYAPPTAGTVKLDTKVKTAEVFIDGGYAGVTGDNKTMHLRPGNHTIEIREAGQTHFSEQVHVTAGQTLKLHPEL